MISPEVFYLHIQGEQRGPYTVRQIDHLLNSGLIAEETLYWREGLEQWQPVTSLVQVRRKANPWIKPLIILGLLIVAAGFLHLFGSVVLIGWKETNQHDYTSRGAYWRARSVVRSEGLPKGAVVQFRGVSTAKVKLNPPHGATVILHGDVSVSAGNTREATWQIPMTFDPENREWSGGPVTEITR